MSQPLDTLLELAERQRDTGLLALREAEAALARAVLQAEQLAGYREQCRERSPVREGRSATIDALRGHEGFMQRLQEAMTQQQRTVQTVQQRANALRTELTMLDMRVASVRKLQQRRTLEAEHVASRQEQRRSDEMAQQRAWRSRSEATAAAEASNPVPTRS